MRFIYLFLCLEICYTFIFFNYYYNFYCHKWNCVYQILFLTLYFCLFVFFRSEILWFQSDRLCRIWCISLWFCYWKQNKKPSQNFENWWVKIELESVFMFKLYDRNYIPANVLVDWELNFPNSYNKNWYRGATIVSMLHLFFQLWMSIEIAVGFIVMRSIYCSFRFHCITVFVQSFVRNHSMCAYAFHCIHTLERIHSHKSNIGCQIWWTGWKIFVRLRSIAHACHSCYWLLRDTHENKIMNRPPFIQPWHVVREK